MAWWDQNDLERAGKMAIDSGLGPEPAYSLWEVDTALLAARMLVSQMIYAMLLGTAQCRHHIERSCMFGARNLLRIEGR